MILAAAFLGNAEISEKEKCLINKNNYSLIINNNNNDDSEQDRNLSTVPNKEIKCITKSAINSKESGTRTIHRFIRCFSISQNAKSILCTNTSPNAMPTINAFK